MGNKFKAVIAFCNSQTEKWFISTFQDDLDIKTVSNEKEFLETTKSEQPDIAVIMRKGPAGGLEAAEQLAIQAIDIVKYVLFIAGELDENIRESVEKVKSAGGLVLSCSPGETISGDELVFLIQSALRDLQQTLLSQNTGSDGIIKSVETIPEEFSKEYTESASNISSELEKSSTKKSGIISKIKSRLEEITEDGISLDENENENLEELIITDKDPTAIYPGGLFAVVSPWRPGLAGRIAAYAAKVFAESDEPVAVICADNHSTAALWLDISNDELEKYDWRLESFKSPITKNNLGVWPVNPTIHQDISEQKIWVTFKEVRTNTTYTVMDFAGNLKIAQKAVFMGRAVLLVIIPGGDPVEQKMSLEWFEQHLGDKPNIVVGIDLRGAPPTIPKNIKPKVIIRNNPADALKMALKSNNGVFMWD